MLVLKKKKRRAIKTGLQLIREERERQKNVEGWTAQHDNQHSDGELAAAARCYELARNAKAPRPHEWPWKREWWKPADRVRNLVKAGALYRAELDRLSRLSRLKCRRANSRDGKIFVVNGLVCELREIAQAALLRVAGAINAINSGKDSSNVSAIQRT